MDPFEYLEDRGFDFDFATAHGLAPSSDDDYVGEGWIRIRYPNLLGEWDPRFNNYQGLPGPKYQGPPGSGTHLYNPLRLGPNAPVIWFAEGEYDTLSLIRVGIPAIGIPGAAVAGRFRNEWRLLFDGCLHIVLALDNDKAGNDAASKLLQVWPQAERWNLPEGVDLNDLLIDGDLGEAAEYHEDLMEQVWNG